MKNTVVAEVSVVPVGTMTPGVSEYVAACLDVLDTFKDIKYQLTPMGTIIEGNLENIFEVVKKMHEVPYIKGAQRVVTTLKIDDRRDKGLTMAGKLDSVLQYRSRIRSD